MAKYEEHLNDNMYIADSVKAEVLRRIESSPDIPDIFKQAVKDLVLENWNQLILDEIIDAIPDEIVKYLPIIKGIISAVKIFMALRTHN